MSRARWLFVFLAAWAAVLSWPDAEAARVKKLGEGVSDSETLAELEARESESSTEVALPTDEPALILKGDGAGGWNKKGLYVNKTRAQLDALTDPGDPVAGVPTDQGGAVLWDGAAFASGSWEAFYELDFRTEDSADLKTGNPATWTDSLGVDWTITDHANCSAFSVGDATEGLEWTGAGFRYWWVDASACSIEASLADMATAVSADAPTASDVWLMQVEMGEPEITIQQWSRWAVGFAESDVSDGVTCGYGSDASSHHSWCSNWQDDDAPGNGDFDPVAGDVVEVECTRGISCLASWHLGYGGAAAWPAPGTGTQAHRISNGTSSDLTIGAVILWVGSEISNTTPGSMRRMRILRRVY